MNVPAGWTRLIGLIGLLILVVVVAHWIVRRKGGWGALRRRVVRELTTAARAFATPVRTALRHRRGLRVLGRLLRDASGWTDAGTALRRAAAERPDARPYAALLGADVVGVYVAHGHGDGALPEPWARDAAEPRLWWISRADLGSAPENEYGGEVPVVVCLGRAGTDAVLLDLTAVPPAVSVTGERRTARAVLQALAAQLDARLPSGRVVVGAGVHPRHHGPTDVFERLDTGYAVSAEAPERNRPGGVRLLTLGVAHHSTLILEADRDGHLRLHGGPPALTVDALPLARAVSRLVRDLPPVPGDGAGAGPNPPKSLGTLSPDDDLVESGLSPTAMAVSATAPRPEPGTAPAAPAATDSGDEDGDLAEPTAFGPAGVSAATARSSSS
ncbi:hypothetical protein [Actinacidiphila sp. bgisy160]|uniref:hypothetical protein n=1 Tax=Actinacidiphila sp. bgisy160 TaxID=3413796 RepID=UPI003D72DB26